MIKELEKIFEAYLIATGKNPQDNSIRMGVESDWLCHKAKNYLDIDSTGLLSILTMMAAYKSFIKENSCTIEELINGDWENLKPKFDKLQNLLFRGKVADVYNKFINLIIKHAGALGKNFTKEEIEKIKKIEDIITTSVEKFNTGNYFQFEKFSEGSTKITTNVSILPRLYRFQHLKLFVDKLKNAEEDNFICMALIDRTYSKIEDEYYDNNLDSFFAFGFKNNGVVWVVSDRVTYDSPEGAFKSRNPGRAMRDKIDYSWLPYYKLNDIKQVSEHINQVLLPFNSNAKETGYNIVDLFDDEGIIYSTLIMTLIYNKYFCQAKDGERKYFSDEIKLLPAAEKKSVILKDQLYLPVLSNNIKADTYKYEGKSYSNSIYDYLIDIYPLQAELPLLKNFIGSREMAEKYIWWNIRKQQADYIKKCLREAYENKHHELEQWLDDNIVKNINNIVEFMITQPDYNGFRENYTSVHSYKEVNDKPYFWEEFRDNKFLNTYSLKTVENRDKFVPASQGHGTISTRWGTIQYSCYGNHNYLVFTDDNDRRYCDIELTLRSHSDFEKFFNLLNEELPVELRKHFYTRSGPCTMYGWMPYTGNSILEFTDPMNDIRNPFDDFGCVIYLFISKSKLKQLKRKVSEKSWYE